jgi:hypothetical protein
LERLGRDERGEEEQSKRRGEGREEAEQEEIYSIVPHEHGQFIRVNLLSVVHSYQLH